MSKLTPLDLRCEHLAAPQGLNTRHPRFTWALRGAGRNRRQTAYRIVVDRDGESVARGEGRLWDSGEVASRDTLLIPYAGHALPSGETVHWAVQVWDEAREASDFSEPAAFHVGLRDPSEWTGKWLARALVPPGGRSPPQDTVYDNPYWARPADYFRREIELKKQVARATLYATALGVYELRLNGSIVGDQVLAPGWTDYHTRVEYQSYNVAHLLRAGANAVGAIVGEGWYCGRVSYDAKRAGSHYGVRPAFLCQLHVEYADGSSEIFITDGEWRTSNEAIVYSDLLLGEKYDARLEQPGWDSPGFNDAAWWQAEVTQPLPQAPRIEAARGQPVRCTVRLDAKFLHRAKSGGMIFDLGQNIAGHSRLEIDAPRDAEFRLRHAEVLAEDGELYVANLRWALQADTYVSKGGKQAFEPRFTVHGFRYVEVEAPASFGPEQIRLTGIAVHSDMPLAGTFACGSAMVNQLVSNIVWTHRDNFLSVPTDCPQRDERMGWLADAQVFLGTAAYNMDVAAFFTKWRLDIADAQTEDGAFTDVAPSRVYTRFHPQPPRGAPGWGDGGVIIPWRIYQRYGDSEMLLQHYDGMVRWMDHIERANPDFVRAHALYSNWGDWLCVGTPSPKALVATAYWAHLASIVAKAAALLGRRQDEARFTALFRDIRRAFQETFVRPDGTIAGDTQTVYLLALDFGLVFPEQREAAVRHLLGAIERADGHLQTGIHGLRHLCRVLSDHGAADLAYDLLLRETYPSWGFSIRNGATTIWERWDGWTPERGFQSVNMNSLNHYALGAIGEWLYARVAGIDFDEADPAFRRIRMRPLPSEKLGWCKASYKGHLGEIRSAWTCGPDGTEWTAVIPPNCTASVTIPARFSTVTLDGRPLGEILLGVAASAEGTTFELGSGEYVFKLAH